MKAAGAGSGTPEDPWQLTTPPGSSHYTAWRDPSLDPPALVVQVGKTQLRYHLRCIEDLHAMLQEHGDWMPLGGADEQKPAAEGTVEAWGARAGQPGRGLLRHQEGVARPLRGLRAAGARGARSRRGRARSAQQPHARTLTASAFLPLPLRRLGHLGDDALGPRRGGLLLQLVVRRPRRSPRSPSASRSRARAGRCRTSGSRSSSFARYSICSQRSPLDGQRDAHAPEAIERRPAQAAELVLGHARAR